MRCAACGTETRPGSRFCDHCGTPLATACPSCGEPNRPDASFCAGCGTALTATPTASAAPGATASAERRLVSVLFTDLVGFTSLAEDRDPESVRELLSRYFETASEIVRAHGGTVEKFIGDAVMAVWGTPVAHEDDAERAVRAALEITDGVTALLPGIEARAGILTGEAAVTVGATNQGMVAGDLVNTAARLQGVAEPGTVLVGEATRRAAEGAIVFEPIGEHSLKGKTSPVPAWRAVRVVANIGGKGRTDALEAPFVGRDEELRQLKEVLHAVGRERRPRLVSITGPGGIGKSRLAWELEKYVDGVAEDIYWHRGRSPSYGEGVAFWALGEMVRRRAGLAEDADPATTRERIAATLAEYVPDASERERIGPALLSLLGVEAAPESGRDVLFPAWRTFFERVAELGTTVLVFEDLQWADAGLLDFIDHLLEWSRGLPIMVVTLARPELFDRRPGWGTAHRHFVSLALEPLPDEAMHELLAGLVPGLPPDAQAAIVGRAEGVPLYAVEMVRSLLADGLIERQGGVYVPTGDLSSMRVPESLRSLIAARLDALAPEDRDLLTDAAVLGQVFGTDALAAIRGTTAAELEPRLKALVRRELLDLERDPASPERGQHKFVQSLIREVAYGTLGRRDRRARHLDVARLYESLGDEALAGALASHYLAAHAASDPGPEADAVAVQARLSLIAAADRAAALGGHEQAIAHLEQALGIAVEPSERAALLDRAARSAALAALPAAERYGVEAVEAYRSLGDTAAVVRATGRLGKVLIEAGSVERARELLAAAVPEAEAAGDDATLAEILANLARAYMRSGDPEQAVAVADRALPIAERLNLEAVVVEAFVNKGSALSILGRRRESIALQEAALALVARLGDLGLAVRVRNNLASAYAEDDMARASRMFVEVRDLSREIGDRGMFHWTAGVAGITAYSEGRDWDDHLTAMREALDTARLPSDRGRLLALKAAIESARGQRPDESLVELETLLGDSADIEDQFAIEMTRFYVAITDDRPDDAYAAAMAARALNTQNPDVALTSALAAAITLRDAERLRQVAPFIDEIPQSGQLVTSMRSELGAARAALEGRTTEATAGFRESRETLARIGAAFDAAIVTLHAAILLPAEPEVRRWADEVRLLLAELRAAAYLAQLDAALARATPAAPEVEPAAPEAVAEHG